MCAGLVHRCADGLRRAVSQVPYAGMDLEVLGPAPASVVKVNNRYRYRITVVGKCTAPVRSCWRPNEGICQEKGKTVHCIFLQSNR